MYLWNFGNTLLIYRFIFILLLSPFYFFRDMFLLFIIICLFIIYLFITYWLVMAPVRFPFLIFQNFIFLPFSLFYIVITSFILFFVFPVLSLIFSPFPPSKLITNHQLLIINQQLLDISYLLLIHLSPSLFFNSFSLLFP